ncbi:MAG: hypothetical protein E7525_03415 [Ruminococcaceae bacterium]|nr:hypothetical protein [Oscillospiraceae bacterium]
MTDYKKILQRFKNLSQRQKTNIAIAIGILGLAIILLSSLLSGSGDGETPLQSEQLDVIAEQYSTSVEEKLESIISDMLGGSRVQVMVTLEGSAEYVYASEHKTDVEMTDDKDSQKVQQNDSDQKNYVVMTDSEGNEKALVVYTKMPQIKGVVVVCDSGQTDAVSSAVRLAVRSALGIDNDKICIIGRYKDLSSVR